MPKEKSQTGEMDSSWGDTFFTRAVPRSLPFTVSEPGEEVWLEGTPATLGPRGAYQRAAWNTSADVCRLLALTAAGLWLEQNQACLVCLVCLFVKQTEPL